MGLLGALGTAAGAYFGGPAGASIGGAIGSSLDQSAVNDQSQANFSAQMDFNREAMQSKYQWQVADMKAAGLNPMLAYGATPGMLGAPGAPMLSNPSAAGAQTGQAVAQIANLDADTKNKDAQSALIQAQTDKTQAEVDQTNASAAQLRQSTVESAARTSEAYARIEQYGHQNNWTDQQISNAQALIGPQVGLAKNQSVESATRAALNNVNLDLLNAKVPMAKNYMEMSQTPFGKSLPYLDPFQGAVNSAGAAALKGVMRE